MPPTRLLSRCASPVGDDEVVVINEAPPVRTTSVPMIRLAAGRRPLPSAAVYYRYADQPLQYPFDWRGYAGGQPSSRPAAETRELGLGGAGLYDSGLNPYVDHYGPMKRRLLTPNRDDLGGILSDLSASERKVAMVAGAAALGFLAWRHLRGKRKRSR